MTLARALDRAIAAENARVIATLCGRCSGTGRYYRKITETRWQPQTCSRCGGSGERNPR